MYFPTFGPQRISRYEINGVCVCGIAMAIKRKRLILIIGMRYRAILLYTESKATKLIRIQLRQRDKKNCWNSFSALIDPILIDTPFIISNHISNSNSTRSIKLRKLYSHSKARQLLQNLKKKKNHVRRWKIENRSCRFEARLKRRSTNHERNNCTFVLEFNRKESL